MDFLSGKQVWKFYKLYIKTQYYSQKEIEQLQINKLKILLKHCYNNVKYYREIINERNIDIHNIDSLDVLYQFPVLTKEIIQANYENFKPSNYNHLLGVKVSQTGGTTGNILFKKNDAVTRSSVWGSYKRYEDWMGFKNRDKTLILMGGHVKKIGIKDRLIHFVTGALKNTVSVDIYNTSDETVEKVISLLQKKKFSHIRSYPQFLFSVAQKLEKKGLVFKMTSISLTAEPLMPEHRVLFKKVFNAEVFDQYGCGEIGGIAYECDKHEGLHITDERVVVESNGLNELIITDLDNLAMPFIRYWNGDQAIISKDKCSCGRESRLFEQIMGRTCDYIIGVDGQFLHWAYFWHLIFDSGIAKNRNVRKFQIVQLNKINLLIRLVSDLLSKQEEEFIMLDIKNRIGDFSIQIKYEAEIENTNTGKYRPVINELL